MSRPVSNETEQYREWLLTMLILHGDGPVVDWRQLTKAFRRRADRNKHMVLGNSNNVMMYYFTDNGRKYLMRNIGESSYAD